MLVDRQTMIWRRALDCNPGSTVVGDRDAGTTWRLVHALVHAPRSGPAIHLTRGAGAVPSRTWRRWRRCNSTPMAVADAASSRNPRAAPRISFYCPFCSINDLACEADVVLGPLR